MWNNGVGLTLSAAVFMAVTFMINRCAPTSRLIIFFQRTFEGNFSSPVDRQRVVPREIDLRMRLTLSQSWKKTASHATTMREPRLTAVSSSTPH